MEAPSVAVAAPTADRQARRREQISVMRRLLVTEASALRLRFTSYSTLIFSSFLSAAVGVCGIISLSISIPNIQLGRGSQCPFQTHRPRL